MLWTYADRQHDGSFKRVGGGTYDATTNTYGQGAFNADDIARAAVVYLRDWQQTGTRRAAGTRRTRCCAASPTCRPPPARNAGNVVLWMQPDGTLHPSADPVEQPDPSDSDASYWLARTVWALGEGYAAFQRTDPAFARFLRRSSRPRDRCHRPSGARRLRPAPRHRRHADPGLADRRRRRRLRRGRARPGRLRARRRPRRRRARDDAADAAASPRCPAATPGTGRSAACCRGPSRSATGTPGPRRCRRRWPHRPRHR